MDSYEDYLELLLSLQQHREEEDEVRDTPPASPLAVSGYFFDEDGPKLGKPLGMTAFKDVVKHCIPEPPEINLPTAPRNPSNPSKTQSTSDIEVERYSGLRIWNRLVSAGSMNTWFSDIRFIRFQAIRTAMTGDNITGCWAIVGVLMEKGNPKLSSTGKNFAVWKLGSLDETWLRTCEQFLQRSEYLPVSESLHQERG